MLHTNFFNIGPLDHEKMLTHNDRHPSGPIAIGHLSDSDDLKEKPVPKVTGKSAIVIYTFWGHELQQ